LQTKLKNLLDKGFDVKDLSYSMQEVVFAMLVEAAERALAHTGKKELLLGGGVACNSRLQEMCKIMCDERGVKFFCPPRPLLVDNAGMIGYLGLKMFKAGLGIPISEMGDVDIAPRERTDDVEVSWR
jgi:tRNA A37 threonylcarbamoyltransferase TsaD